MLASLLPGLRHLRAPLASGCIWLLGLWLLLRPLLPPNNRASGPYKDLLDLADYAGKPAVLVAAGFTAYLIGTLSVAAGRAVNRVLYQLAYVLRVYRYKWTSRLSPGRWQESRMQQDITDAVVNTLAARFLDDEAFRTKVITHVTDAQDRAESEERSLLPSVRHLAMTDLEQAATQHYYLRWTLLNEVVETGAYIASTEEELEYVAHRLLGRDDALYGEFDRERAESVFFAGVALPIAFVVAVLVFRVTPWWIVGLLVSFAFAWLSAEAWARSTESLARALAAGRVETPVLQRLADVDIELVPYDRLVAPDRPSQE